MEKTQSNKVVIAALMGDDLFDYINRRLNERFSGEEVIMNDFSKMGLNEVRSIASGRTIDLAVVDFDLYQIESQRNKLEELFTYGALDDKGAMTDFVMLYNAENADKLSELNETLLNRRIAMTSVSFDDKNDELNKTIVVQSVHAAVGRLQDEKASLFETRKDMEDFINGIN